MTGEEVKKLYEQLDTVADDLEHPELVMPDLLSVLQTLVRATYSDDGDVRITVRRWMAKYDV